MGSWRDRRKEMVKVSIIVEGGVIDTNVSAGTIDNSNALRESLYWIFSGRKTPTSLSSSHKTRLKESFS